MMIDQCTKDGPPRDIDEELSAAGLNIHVLVIHLCPWYQTTNLHSDNDDVEFQSILVK